MLPVLHSLIAGLPIFLLHLGTALAVLAAALTIYMWITPQDEIGLIRTGNMSAAISLGGAAVGLAVPLALCLAASVNVWDVLIWGIVTLLVQIVVFRVVDLILRDLPRRIERDERPAAVLLAAIKLAVALLTAAAVAG